MQIKSAYPAYALKQFHDLAVIRSCTQQFFGDDRITLATVFIVSDNIVDKRFSIAAENVCDLLRELRLVFGRKKSGASECSRFGYFSSISIRISNSFLDISGSS